MVIKRVCGGFVVYILFCIPTGGDRVLAIVIRTGYLTAKGQLVRSIMYPPPADFKFDQDSYKFIGVLAAIAIGSFVYTIGTKVGKFAKNLLRTYLLQSLNLGSLHKNAKHQAYQGRDVSPSSLQK